jgi:hypothetical protein
VKKNLFKHLKSCVKSREIIRWPLVYVLVFWCCVKNYHKVNDLKQYPRTLSASIGHKSRCSLSGLLLSFSQGVYHLKSLLELGVLFQACVMADSQSLFSGLGGPDSSLPCVLSIGRGHPHWFTLVELLTLWKGLTLMKVSSGIIHLDLITFKESLYICHTPEYNKRSDISFPLLIVGVEESYRSLRLCKAHTWEVFTMVWVIWVVLGLCLSG